METLPSPWTTCDSAWLPSQEKIVFPDVQREPPVFQSVPISLTSYLCSFHPSFRYFCTLGFHLSPVFSSLKNLGCLMWNAPVPQFSWPLAELPAVALYWLLYGVVSPQCRACHFSCGTTWVSWQPIFELLWMEAQPSGASATSASVCVVCRLASLFESLLVCTDKQRPQLWLGPLCAKLPELIMSP